MPMNWLVLFGVLIGLTLLFVSLIAFLGRAFPTPENRPSPTGLIAANEQARLASLQRVAARANRQQRQRDASARLTKGW